MLRSRYSVIRQKVMLEMNTKYSSHNSVLLPFWGNCFEMPLISADRYFRELIGGQKINVTFREAVTFVILRYLIEHPPL